jgi:hypothetical protein
MAVTPKSNLLELIKSLTTSEKRYLKQFINNSGETKSNHAKLLDAIVKQEVPDEEKLKKKLKNTSIVKQWSRVKNYLYNYILRVLQSYYQQDGEFEVLNNLQQIFILYKKGIFEEAYKLLMKTKYLVSEGSYPTLLPFIADWEMRMGHIAQRYGIEDGVVDFEENNNSAIDIAGNLLEYNKLRVNILSNKTEKGRYLRMKEDNEKVLNEDCFCSLDRAKSPMAKWAFLTTKSLLYGQQGDYLSGFHEAKKCMRLHEEYPLLEKQTPFAYITTINTFAIDAIQTKNWEEIPFIIEKIEAYIQEYKASSVSVLLTSIKYNALLKMSIQQGDYAKGLEYVEAAELFVSKNKHVTNVYVRANLLLHYAAHIYVVNGAYEKALIAIEKLEPIQQIPIYKTATALLKLICLFEQDEILLLPYTLRSVYRDLLNKKDLYGIERIVLNLLKASVKVASKRELAPIFQKYLIKLQAYIAVAPKEELELLDHFNYVAWVESKVIKRPLIALLENDYEQAVAK